MRNNSNDVEMEEDESASTSHSQNLPVERQKQLTRQLRSMISDVQSEYLKLRVIVPGLVLPSLFSHSW